MKLVDVSFSYSGQNTLFDKINFHISPGEIVSVVGASGCGKSSLLKLICGLEKPTSGQMQDAQNFSGQISFVFQEHALLPWLNLYENVALPSRLQNTPINHDKISQLLDLLQISKAKTQFPHELSGGMKMRASIARALSTNPKMILFDEPFSALDEVIREDLQTEIRTILKSQKISAVLVTHSLQESVYMSDRVVYMNKKSQLIGEIAVQLSDTRQPEIKKETSFFALTEKIKNLWESSL